jgi:predicted RNA binding protein YcfA (HicA-like mRNA interferase family)
VPLKPPPYREVKRKLEAAGFTEVSQKGSHVKFVKDTGEGVYTAIVPHHRGLPLVRSVASCDKRD